MGFFDKLFPGDKKAAFPPTPKWRPNTPIDIDEIVNYSKSNIGNMQFVVFKYGTVAFLPNRVDNVQDAALSALAKVYNYHPDFRPKTRNDGNVIVHYLQPVYNIVFKHEIETYWDYIDKNHLDGICKDEVLIDGTGQPNVLDKLGKICLFGRAKMFMDAQAPKIVRTFEPPKS
jgi:hypothetical protein